MMLRRIRHLKRGNAETEADASHYGRRLSLAWICSVGPSSISCYATIELNGGTGAGVCP